MSVIIAVWSIEITMPFTPLQKQLLTTVYHLLINYGKRSRDKKFFANHLQLSKFSPSNVLCYVLIIIIVHVLIVMFCSIVLIESSLLR